MLLYMDMHIPLTTASLLSLVKAVVNEELLASLRA